jgi:NAD-dependent dihydropyrimidine dehydrogenase PreA subunit
MNRPPTIVISRDRTVHSAQQQIEHDVLAALSGRKNIKAVIVPHLYDLAADGPAMQALQAIDGDAIVLAWLYPRAIFWTLDANRVQGRMGATSFFAEEELSPPISGAANSLTTARNRTIWCIDLRGLTETAPLIQELERIISHGQLEPSLAIHDKGKIKSDGMVVDALASSGNGHVRIDETTRERWYPVVDHDRCGNCMECLNFCLFGVYSLNEDGKVAVEQPDSCRDGCPACARVCPAGAIMFPQHDSPAIAGGSTGMETAAPIDVNALLGGIKNLSAAERAAAERLRAVAGNKQSDPAKTAPSETGHPSAKDALDDLIDEFDLE